MLLDLKKNPGRGQAVRSERGHCKKIMLAKYFLGGYQVGVVTNLKGDSCLKKNSSFLMSASG